MGMHSIEGEYVRSYYYLTHYIPKTSRRYDPYNMYMASSIRTIHAPKEYLWYPSHMMVHALRLMHCCSSA